MNAAIMRNARIQWGLTQGALAERMGVHRRTYIQLEMGERDLLRWHVLSLERISIDIAVERSDPSLLLGSMKFVIDHLIALQLEQDGVDGVVELPDQKLDLQKS